ncbi:uncharacterized protein RCH25_017946 [Pelodytes ibericus]
MESSSGPLQHQYGTPHQSCVTLYQCSYPNSEGYSSLSPASSTDSCGLSPLYMTYTTSDNVTACDTKMRDLRINSNCDMERKNKKGKVKLAHSQRQSASEREKLRMRNLSKALQNLRRYLPPSVVPVDKNLTKIETLNYTIDYISHLSAQLGLTEDVLEKRRLATIQESNRCPHSLIYCVDRTQKLCSDNTGQIYKQVVPARSFIETEHFPVEPEIQNMPADCQLPYRLPQVSKGQSDPTQHQYSSISTTLAQPENQYYSTDFHQMITNEDYTDLREMWRREAHA